MGSEMVMEQDERLCCVSLTATDACLSDLIETLVSHSKNMASEWVPSNHLNIGRVGDRGRW